LQGGKVVGRAEKGLERLRVEGSEAKMNFIYWVAREKKKYIFPRD